MTQPPAAATEPATSQLDAYLAHFQWRVLQDALTEATAEHWEHRATALEWARPRPGDYLGTDQTPATIRAKYLELTQVATHCRRHAALIRESGLDTEAHAAIALVLTEPQPTPGRVA